MINKLKSHHWLVVIVLTLAVWWLVLRPKHAVNAWGTLMGNTSVAPGGSVAQGGETVGPINSSGAGVFGNPIQPVVYLIPGVSQMANWSMA